ncbi:GNAT family N-acetyltransferase [Paractinoplanes lichenicola]|uniref:GNAT family N-acetyltransferase n=1 Tax=Paractinoplanes lichenicola TaxID=2802976 RepID=A0ABS1VZR1_9ACTN|nr:GNAT family N-acetyltransferase [Actinoplanes lichenicola]MBL7259918.1 GNAT family N-acetyltransferase [Actinoplanes lichenicola]
MTTVDRVVLDNPVWCALTGPQRRFAISKGQAARYQPEVSPFVALADAADPAAWADLAELVEPGTTVLMPGAPDEGPAVGWELVGGGKGVQLTGEDLVAAPDPEVVTLGAVDVPEMLDLVARTKPGPFGPRTLELGGYRGIRHDGKLVAMAGERVRPPGWAEISAVCTDPAFRGRGLANRLVRAVAAGIQERGERPFLHAAGNNDNAIRLYLAMGFRHRRDINFHAYRIATR